MSATYRALPKATDEHPAALALEGVRQLQEQRAVGGLATRGRTGFGGHREGHVVYARPDGIGNLLAADQRPGASRYATSEPLGPAFAQGLVVAMRVQVPA